MPERSVPVATRAPFGLKRAVVTPLSWPRRACFKSPLVESQMRAVMSAEPVRTLRSSGLNSAHATSPPWRSSGVSATPSRARQIRAVPSADAVTTRSPPRS
jgi:hypothetical protein